MYQVMNRALLLASLLLLVSAAPATRPVEGSERLIVQVRHVEYATKPNTPASNFSTSVADIPADAKEVTSLQVLGQPGAPFETVAVINGTRYRLSGKLKTATSSDGKDYIRVEFAYLESSDKDHGGNITQISSNVMILSGESIRIGGMMNDTNVVGLILTLKQPDPAPQR